MRVRMRMRVCLSMMLKAGYETKTEQEDMSSEYAAKGVMSPLEVKKAWKARRHPALAAKAAKPLVHDDRKG